MLKIGAKLQIKPLTRRILISFFHNNSAYKYNLRLLFVLNIAVRKRMYKIGKKRKVVPKM